MEAILFDLDGVFYQQGRLLPGAADCLAWVRQAGIPHLFLTNTSSRPRRAVVDKLYAMGLSVDEKEILTPAVAAAAYCGQAGMQPLGLFVAPATREDFAGLDSLPDDAQSGAAVVVVGDLGEAWDFVTLNRAFRLLMAGDAELLALGMTRYWQADDGLRLDVGPMVSALAFASGCEPLVLGKPAEAFFAMAVDRLGMAPDQVLMIGDDIIGDVQGAQRAGLRGVLVRTGKFREQDLDRGIAPDGIIGSIADLPDWWRKHGGRADG